MKQEVLAAAVGYGSRSGIASIEAGDVLPSVDKALEIARVLGVGIEEILGDRAQERGATERHDEGVALRADARQAASHCLKETQHLAHALTVNLQHLEALVAY